MGNLTLADLGFTREQAAAELVAQWRHEVELLDEATMPALEELADKFDRIVKDEGFDDWDHMLDVLYGEYY